MRRLAHRVRRAVEQTANQPEFALRVSVCAWCKPVEPGATVVALSHGICLRHFRELRLQLQSRLPSGEGTLVARPARRPRRRGQAAEEIAQLRFPFPAPISDVAPFSA